MRTALTSLCFFFAAAVPDDLLAQGKSPELSVQWSPERNKEDSGELEKVVGSTSDAVYLLLHEVSWLGDGGTSRVLGSYTLEKLSLPGLTTSTRMEVKFENRFKESLVACFQLGDQIAMVTERKEGKQHTAVLRQWSGVDLQPVGSEMLLGSWTSYSMYTTPTFTVQTSPNASKFLLWTWYFKNKNRQDNGQLCMVYDEQAKLLYKVEAGGDVYWSSSPWGSGSGCLISDEPTGSNLVLSDAGAVDLLSAKVGPPPAYEMSNFQHISFSVADQTVKRSDLPQPPSGQEQRCRIFLSGEQQVPTIAQLFFETQSKKLRSVNLTGPRATTGAVELDLSNTLAATPLRVQGGVEIDGYGLIARDHLLGIDPIYKSLEFHGDAIVLHGSLLGTPGQTVVKLPLLKRDAMPGFSSAPFLNRWLGVVTDSPVFLFNDDCAQREAGAGAENEARKFHPKNACLRAAVRKADGFYGYTDIGAPQPDGTYIFIPETAKGIAPKQVFIAVDDERTMDSQFGKDMYYFGLLKF